MCIDVDFSFGSTVGSKNCFEVWNSANTHVVSMGEVLDVARVWPEG